MNTPTLRLAGAALAGALATLAIVTVISVARPQTNTTQLVQPATTNNAPVSITNAPREPRPFDQVVVSTDWLAANLNNPQVRVIEVSVVPGLYERGHILGAVNFVWTTDFVDTVARNIIAPERFQELARAAGINNDTTIVLYGDNYNWFAA